MIALVSEYLAHIVVLREHLQTHCGYLFQALMLFLAVGSRTAKTNDCSCLEP